MGGRANVLGLRNSYINSSNLFAFDELNLCHVDSLDLLFLTLLVSFLLFVLKNIVKTFDCQLKASFHETFAKFLSLDLLC